MAERKRLSEAEKQRLAEERRAANEAARRQAELEYAEDYRRKLQRDKKRKEAEERREREAREAEAREQRAAQIAAQLEADKKEAEARDERSRALLEKIIAARENTAREAEPVSESADEDVITPDTSASEPEEAEEVSLEEPSEEVTEEPSEEVSEEAPDADIPVWEDAEEAPAEEAEQEPAPESITEASESSEEGKILLSIDDDRIVLNITADGATVEGGAYSGVHIHEITPEEALYREGTAVSVRDGITVSTDDGEDAPREQILEAEGAGYDDPITSKYPEVAAIKMAGRAISAKSEFRKYINDSKSAVKRFAKKIEALEDALLIENMALESAAAVLVEMLGLIGAIVEIRCDNLRITAKFGQRRYIPEIKRTLAADIDRYNGKAAEFTARTGERLTRLSPSLVERVSDGTGAEVIPVFSYNEKYIEIYPETKSKSTGAVTVNLPTGAERATLIPETAPEKGAHIYKIETVQPAVAASDMLLGEPVTDTATYKDYLKSAARAERSIDDELEKLRAGIIRAERRTEELDKKLDRRRAAFDKMLATMNHGIAAIGGRDKGLEALDKEREKCEKIEKKIELQRAYAENESKNAKILVGCLALERERLFVALNTLIAAKATSQNKLILRAKNALISEMARYNDSVDECSRYIDVKFTPVTAALADAALAGDKSVSVPQIALLSELVETVGEESRVIGARTEVRAPRGYTLTVNSDGESRGTKKRGQNTPIRTFHGRFFMGGAAPGNIAGAGLEESDIALAAAMSAPMSASVGGDGADPSVAIGAAMAVSSSADAEYYGEPAADDGAMPYAAEQADQTAIDEPVIEEATAEEPVIEKAVLAEPAVEEAVFEEPIIEEIPAEEPVITEEPEEAPIAEAQPRRLRRRIIDDIGEEDFVDEPYPEKLIEDEILPDSEPIIYEDAPDGDISSADAKNAAQAPIEPLAEQEPKKKKIKLRQLPPPEKSDTTAEELRPVTDEGPIYPGNTINKDYIDEDDFDPKDSTKIPSVIEIDDNAEEVENDILLKPTKSGLKKHLSYVNKKIRKALRERRRLLSAKKKAEGVAAAARVMIQILGVQKRIIDWYCNAETSCVDLGAARRAKKIAGALRSELKRYNRYVKEYQKLTGDRLTEASLETPALILEGEDYQIIPKVKIREFEAPEDGVVYADGVTENADYMTEVADDVVMTEKELNKKLNSSARELSKLHGELEAKVKEKHNAWGIDKTIYTVECFGIQKKIIDTLAGNLRAACQVSSVKKIQSLKKDLVSEVKLYNRLVNEYKTVSGNDLTRASDNIAQDIIAGNLYIPLPKVGCVYMGDDDDLNGELRQMSRNSYGVEDDSYGIGGVAFRTKVTSQANKDISLITKRADYQISMLESERDILSYRFGKEPRDVKREKREIAKRISSIRAQHKTALGYESSDNRRYYATVTANPYTMELKNKRADRARIAAIRSKIINLLNERDIVNGKLIALYTGAEGVVGISSVNQEWRRIKNDAALKAKKKQKALANTVKHLPITLSEKTKVYNLMNEKIDAASTLALVKKRLKKEKLHKEDKLCAKQDIKAQKARVKELDKKIEAQLRSINSRINDAQATTSWYVAFIVLLCLVVLAVALYIYYISPYISSLFA